MFPLRIVPAHTLLTQADGPLSSLPLYALPVSAGFPSPADGFIETRLDLNEHCIRNPVSTYFARIGGQAWGDLGVARGDELIVDRSLDPVDGSLVLADVEGTRSLFRVTCSDRQIILTDGIGCKQTVGNDVLIWGVVTYIVRRVG